MLLLSRPVCVFSNAFICVNQNGLFMKATSMFVCAFLALGITCHAQGKRITVEANEMPGTDFGKYKTFSFSPMIASDLDVDFFFLDDLVLKTRIREAIADELMGLGYRSESRTPDLIVTFRVFDRPATLSTVEENGPRLWGGLSYATIGEVEKHDVKAGTLVISFADRKSSQVVFEGFASGLIDNDKFIKDEVKIREAVDLIIENYNHRAKNYTRK